MGTILTPGSMNDPGSKKNVVGKKMFEKKRVGKKKVGSPGVKKRLGPEAVSSDKLLDKARIAGKSKSGTITATPSGIEKLAEEIIENVGRHSGSSRTSSGLSHDGSDVDILSYKLISQLPKKVEISPR